MILGVSNSGVAVARNFPVSFRDWSGDLVRVKVTAGLSMDQADRLSVAWISEILFRLILYVATVWVEEPVVVRIFVVIAGNLLLGRAFRIGLVMGVKETASIAHILKRGSRSKCNFKRTILSDLSTPEIGLEQGAHLGVSGAAVL